MAHTETQAGDDLAVAVVRAVAETKGIDPADVDERLYDAVDPEALDRLFRGTDTGRVTFAFAGRTVKVTADRTVSVRE